MGMMMEDAMNLFLGFMNEVAKFFLRRVKDTCVIVQRGSSEEVYDGSLAGILHDCVWRCLRM